MSSSFARGLIATRSGGDIPFSPAQIPGLFCWFRGDKGADIVNGKYVSVVDQAAPEYVFAQSNAGYRADASTWAGKSVPVFDTGANGSSKSLLSSSRPASDWDFLSNGESWTVLLRMRNDYTNVGSAYILTVGVWNQSALYISTNSLQNGTWVVALRRDGAYLYNGNLRPVVAGQVSTLVIRSDGGAVTCSVNDMPFTTTGSYEPGVAQYTQPLAIGSTGGNPIPEVLFYRRALDNDELSLLTTYLEEEWPGTSPIFSMMGKDPDAVIEDGKFVSIPDRGSVPGAVVSQSVVGRRPEVVQWGGDGENAVYMPSGTILVSDRPKSQFKFLTDRSGDYVLTWRCYNPVLLSYQCLVASNSGSGSSGVGCIVVNNAQGNLEVHWATGTGSNNFMSFNSSAEVGMHTYQLHVTSLGWMTLYRDGELEGTSGSRPSTTVDLEPTHTLHVGDSISSAYPARQTFAAIRIDPGPVSLEMMRSIREEIEAVYPNVVANNIADLYVLKPGVVFDEDMLITSAPGFIIEDPVVQYLGVIVPDENLLLYDNAQATEAFILSNFSVAVQPIVDAGVPPTIDGVQYVIHSPGDEPRAIEARIEGDKLEFLLGKGSWDGGGLNGIVEFDINRRLLGGKILQFSRVDKELFIHIDGEQVAKGGILDSEYYSVLGDLVFGGGQSGGNLVCTYIGAWGIGSVADIPRVYRKVRDIVSPWTEDPVVVHADVSDPSTVIESGTITSITNKGAFGGQFLPTDVALEAVQVNGLNAAAVRHVAPRMELQGPEDREFKFLHDNTVPWQMTVVVRWVSVGGANVDVIGNRSGSYGIKGGAKIYRRPTSVSWDIAYADGTSGWYGGTPNGTAPDGAVSIVTFRFTPGDPSLVELFVDGVLQGTDERAVGGNYPFAGDPNSPFAIGTYQGSNGDFDICEIIVEKDHVDRYAELSAKWVATNP